MTSAAQRKAQRQRLFDKQGGKCYWCGIDTILPCPDVSPTHPRLATTDHLFSRSSPMRGQIQGPNHVVACFKCNQKRGRMDRDAARSGQLMPARFKGGLTHDMLMRYSVRHEQQPGMGTEGQASSHRDAS